MKSPSDKQADPSALQILKQRYANGELSREQYLQMREDLFEPADEPGSGQTVANDELFAAVYSLITQNRGTEASSILAGLLRALYLDGSVFHFDRLEGLDETSRRLAEDLIRAKLTGAFPLDRWEKAYQLTREFETARSRKAQDGRPQVFTWPVEHGVLPTEAAPHPEPPLQDLLAKTRAGLEAAKARASLAMGAPAQTESPPAVRPEVWKRKLAAAVCAVALVPLLVVFVVSRDSGVPAQAKRQATLEPLAGSAPSPSPAILEDRAARPTPEVKVAALPPRQEIRTDGGTKLEPPPVAPGLSTSTERDSPSRPKAEAQAPTPENTEQAPPRSNMTSTYSSDKKPSPPAEKSKEQKVVKPAPRELAAKPSISAQPVKEAPRAESQSITQVAAMPSALERPAVPLLGDKGPSLPALLQDAQPGAPALKASEPKAASPEPAKPSETKAVSPEPVKPNETKAASPETVKAMEPKSPSAEPVKPIEAKAASSEPLKPTEKASPEPQAVAVPAPASDPGVQTAALALKQEVPPASRAPAPRGPGEDWLGGHEELDLGLKDFASGNYQNAVDSLQKALNTGLNLKRDRVNAHKHLALAQCAQGQESLCRDTFSRLLKLDPEHELDAKDLSHRSAEAAFRSAKATVGKKADPAAQPAPRSPTARDPGEDWLGGHEELNLGIEQFAAGHYQEAAGNLQKALNTGLSLKRDRVKAQKHLALAHCAQGRDSLCRDAFQRLLKLDPEHELDAAELGYRSTETIFRSVKAASTAKTDPGGRLSGGIPK